ELGWRGYALSKLLKAHSPLIAGLIVGVLWGSLHVALTLPGMINAGAPPLPTLLGLIGLSVLATWLYIRTNGNLLLTSLLHAARLWLRQPGTTHAARRRPDAGSRWFGCQAIHLDSGDAARR